jgi:hypothetical protein
MFNSLSHGNVYLNTVFTTIIQKYVFPWCAYSNLTYYGPCPYENKVLKFTFWYWTAAILNILIQHRMQWATRRTS